jgi:hypothetical protein
VVERQADGRHQSCRADGARESRAVEGKEEGLPKPKAS